VSNLLVPPPIASAAAVFCGRHGDVTRLAQSRNVFRQTLYREAHAVAQAVAPAHQAHRILCLRQQIAHLQSEIDQLQQQRRSPLVLDADKQALFASTAQALGVSLSATRALLGVLLGAATPSVAWLGRQTQQAGRQASAVLAVLDEPARGRARQIAADEIFVGRRPVLMTIEQDSLCWLGGRLADRRDGDEWAKEFANLPTAVQVTRDGGQGMEKGLQVVNAQRHKDGAAAIADQEDHFPILHRGRRGLREVRAKAVRAFRQAEKVQARYRRDRRRGKVANGRASALARCWRQAEQAFDRWSAQERAFERLRAGLRLFTAAGELHTPEGAEAEVRAALAEWTGPEWSRLRTRLVGPKAFTFLGRVQQQLAALPVPAELREAAVTAEGLRRQPEGLRGEGAAAGALRAVLLACGVVLSLAGAAGEQARTLVRGVLLGAWRSSSLVEGLNSVLRMQQRRQKRMTQGLLDLKRLYWNCHVFAAGRRKGESPYQRLGVLLPPGEWWQLLRRTPEQLRDQLSELNTAA
jgi:hypothetical protein